MDNLITKSWFYKNIWGEINIWDNLEIDLFLRNNSWKVSINIWEKSSLNLYCFFDESSPEILHINQNKNSSKLITKIIFWNERLDLKTNFRSYINSDFSSSQVDIVSFIKENKLYLDSLIEIEENLKKVSWFLNIENIFIWKSWKIKWIPSLLVRSNDVKAGHSCKIHRLDENKMFYLKSRWLKNDECSSLIVESYFENLFSPLKNNWVDFYSEFLNLN